MEDTRLPKKLLFGWLQKRRPDHGTKMWWRDKVRKDVKKFNIKDDEWCLTVQDRRVWSRECKEDLKECTQERLENDRRRGATAVASLRQSEHDVVSNHLECGTCHRSFRRKLDTERQMPEIMECTSGPERSTWNSRPKHNQPQPKPRPS